MENHKNKGLRSILSRYSSRSLWVVLAVLVVLLVVLVVYLFNLYQSHRNVVPPETTLPEVVETLPPETTEPEATEQAPLVMLDRFLELYAQNPDLAGWITIADTVVDYPVVHTPDDPEKYLRKDFNGWFSMEGTLLIDGKCSTVPESDNTIIYGHNMQRGTMFHTLMEYQHKEFWEEHPIINYATLYEEREYEIIAAFYDRVYFTYERGFQFYEFIDYETEEEFQEAIDYYQRMAQYDTEVEPEFGDKLLTLVTCSYHQRYGRFVVVARMVTEDDAETTDATIPVETVVPTETVEADPAA